MKFLIDEDLPHSLVTLFRNYGYDAVHVIEVELRGSKDREIAYYAKREKAVIVTGDYDFSDVRNYPPSQYSGIVVIELPRNATALFIYKQFEWFLQQQHIVENLSGKLLLLEPGRIRIRNS